MMGIHQRQDELWAKAVDLGSRIPEDHLLRKLDKVLDLGFVREEVAPFYGERGNVSIDPVVLMRMMLLLFIDNVRSERQLIRDVPLRIDYLRPASRRMSEICAAGWSMLVLAGFFPPGNLRRFRSPGAIRRLA